MERITEFGSSLWGVFVVAIISGAYIRIAITKFSSELFDSESEGTTTPIRKTIELISVPFILWLVFCPTAEELIFRGPLIIVFDKISDNAWIGIWLSALVFGLLHYFGLPKLLAHLGVPSPPTLTAKILKLLVTMAGGVSLGYYGVKHQSLWLVVGLHSLYNLSIIILGALLAFGIPLLINWYHRLRKKPIRGRELA